MLVLARKTSEAIRIGDNIVIKVIAIRGGQVKIGIEAPPDVRVTRSDVRTTTPPAAGTDTGAGAAGESNSDH